MAVDAAQRAYRVVAEIDGDLEFLASTAGCRDQRPAPASKVRAWFDPETCSLFDRETGLRLRPGRAEEQPHELRTRPLPKINKIYQRRGKEPVHAVRI